LLEVFIFAPLVGAIIDGSQRILIKKMPELTDDEEGKRIIRLKANVYSLSICSTLGVIR
jgi:hypothetical protein